jgi:hypothetical protein
MVPWSSAVPGERPRKVRGTGGPDEAGVRALLATVQGEKPLALLAVDELVEVPVSLDFHGSLRY